MAATDYDVIKELPGYKVILKAVLKSQIQQLVEQLAKNTDEESVILTASVADGTLSHLGSESGKGFLEDHEDIKSQFLGFCLKNHHRKLEAEKERLSQAAEALKQSIHTSPGRYRSPPGSYQARSPRFPAQRGRAPAHPVVIHRASSGRPARSGVRHEPYIVVRPQRQTSIPGASPTDSDAQGIKIEIASDNDNDTYNQDNPEDSKQFPSIQINTQSSETFSEKDDEVKSESSNSTIPIEPLAEGLSLDSDLSSVISGPSQTQTSESSEIDPNVSVKIEAGAESDEELEITGIEPGRIVVPKNMWDPSVSKGMNFDPSQGATGNQEDLAAQGYSSFSNVSEFEKMSSLTMDPENSSVLINYSDFYSTREFSGTTVYICGFKDCGKCFQVPRSMLRHIRVHTKEKPFQCSFCSYQCSRKDHLKVHVKVKHGNFN